MGVKFTEPEGRSAFGQGIQIHLKKIYRKFAVDVMEFVFIFAVSLFEIFFINLFEVVEIVRTFGVHTFMDDEMFSVLFGNKSVPTVRTAEFHEGKPVFLRRELCIAYFAEKLPFGAIIPVKVRFGSITPGTAAVFGDITLGAPSDGFDCLPIAFFEVGDQFSVGPVLTEIRDERKLINLIFLIFRRMGIVKSPLFQRDVSADKSKKTTNSFLLCLNNLE